MLLLSTIILEMDAKIHYLFLLIFFLLRVAYSTKITGKTMVGEGILTDLRHDRIVCICTMTFIV